jgi:hypothetical protein
MRFVRILSLVLLVGFCAVIARADATTPGDPRVRADDPVCPTGAYCVTIESTTAVTVPYCDPFVLLLDPSACPGTPFNLAVADPPGFYSVPPVYTCGSNIFGEAVPTGTLFPTITFTGCNFADGTIPADTPITISSMGGPVILDLPEGFTCPDGGCSDGQIDLTPEPRTSVLFVTGLLLFSLAGFARKRLGAKPIA